MHIAGDIFLFKALVELGPRLVTLLHAMAAPAAAVIGWLLLGEVYGPRQWLGIGVTLAGVALVIISFERPTGFSGWMNQNWCRRHPAGKEELRPGSWPMAMGLLRRGFSGGQNWLWQFLHP